MEFVVLVGIPGSGKSALVKSRFPHHRRINLDTLKSRHIEDIEISYALLKGQSIVVDNTNTTRKARRKYIDIAKKLGLPVRAIYLDCPLEIALSRNSRRAGEEFVPERAVRFYHKILQAPDVDEGFDSVEVIPSG
jgi:bifunctional polynucleotide phosphatase/kinase